MSISALKFPLFSRLPAEIRDEIWRYCLPHRVRELDKPWYDVIYMERDNVDCPCPCKLWHTTLMNKRPPLISRVCHESRSVALKAGRLLETSYHSGFDVRVAWQDRVRDSAHMSWEPGCDVDMFSTGDPLRRLVDEASHMASGGSLMIKYLDQSYGWPHFLPTWNDFLPEGPVPLSAERLRDREALKQVPNWLVVMRIIVVHSKPKLAAATGLFGLLGDARVQVVDVCEEAKVNALLELAETCEGQSSNISSRQDFHQGSADSMRKTLRDVVMGQYQSEELAAAMRPAIMFRLCVQMCNHVGHEHQHYSFERQRYENCEDCQ